MVDRIPQRYPSVHLLYEAYGDIKRVYDDQIKADFAELYQASHGIPLL